MKKMNSVLVTVLVTLTFCAALFYGYRQYNRQKQLEDMIHILIDSDSDPAPDSKDDNVTVTAETLYELIRPAAKLVTAEYTYSNIAAVTDCRDIKGFVLPLTTDKIVFTYTGTIYAGIDLHDVTFEVNNESRTIYIALPQPKKTAHEIDTSSYRFETVKDSIFTEIDPSELTKKANELKLEQEAKAKENGTLYHDANANAESVLRDLLSQASVTEGYHLKFSTAK